MKALQKRGFSFAVAWADSPAFTARHPASKSTGRIGRSPLGRVHGRAFACAPSCGTFVAMTTEALRTVKDRFSEYVDRVEREHERVVVTRNGRAAAVLISPEDLASLEETLALLADSEAPRDLQRAQEEIARGEGVRGVEAVRALRPRRR